ncbi:methylated-DNA--[protein]-cysteine S-methyltransferase [Flammeovirga yaeyamensis]|uniref:methylated-DNA--[protein]-cysteine S-methyltransferase n=1 Tax=Flammeovirga yaeyamensis TaxID=367791 RepID=A0AAX1N9A6_9BACT|nr:methylated-DNA--[protein]-cysteine S-methyltransferase [Flammeovirga yaeyamensis]MBB3699579.1 AraC family transcriptional regulator of adaptative response/methylated-DNA-[protein]-cysteine methyltransferase [Flammeovirga yaeyamensis]NMF35166.1 methylated-DNA--[protein]-cysteine S-methyltransferase [Flammeovirga yaeyamensis]QWG04030.1 methylated-DNA--[protein]-cysteine S-methyltransferase [Flammeovirga yaeyamensis]
MLDNKTYQYYKIAEAIAFIDDNHKGQPSLDAIAEHVNLSPFHFQRLFKEWVGISPKKYLKFISSNYAKSLLRKKESNLFDTAYEMGLSGTGRLHDMFVTIEGMTPGEYKNGGSNLIINYNFAETPFGEIIVATTNKGICHMAFSENNVLAFEELKAIFPKAIFNQKVDKFQQDALFIFRNDWTNLNEIKLHLKGTKFQLKVWEALLSIPYGNLYSYGEIAEAIQHPKASRAVGTAIGNNPIAYLIPCHRVIQKSGNIGGYHWNPTRKKAIIGWEASILENE